MDYSPKKSAVNYALQTEILWILGYLLLLK